MKPSSLDEVASRPVTPVVDTRPSIEDRSRSRTDSPLGDDFAGIAAGGLSTTAKADNDAPSKRQRLTWFLTRMRFRDGWPLARTFLTDVHWRRRAFDKAKRWIGQTHRDEPVCDVRLDPLFSVGEILTQRLRMEPIRASHLDELVEMFPIDESAASVSSLSSRSPRLVDLAFLSDLANNDRTWVIHDSERQVCVGVCAVGSYPVQGRMLTEIGYWLGSSFRGNGYATEAAAAVLAKVQQTLDRPYLGSLIGPDNDASIAVAQRLGMTCQGPLDFRGGTALLFLTPKSVALWSAAQRDAPRSVPQTHPH